MNRYKIGILNTITGFPALHYHFADNRHMPRKWFIWRRYTEIWTSLTHSRTPSSQLPHICPSPTSHLCHMSYTWIISTQRVSYTCFTPTQHLPQLSHTYSKNSLSLPSFLQPSHSLSVTQLSYFFLYTCFTSAPHLFHTFPISFSPASHFPYSCSTPDSSLPYTCHIPAPHLHASDLRLTSAR